MNSVLLTQTQLVAKTYDALNILLFVSGALLGLIAISLLFQKMWLAACMILAIIGAGYFLYPYITPDRVFINAAIFSPVMGMAWCVARLMPFVFGLPIPAISILAAAAYFSWDLSSGWVNACRRSRGIENCISWIEERPFYGLPTERGHEQLLETLVYTVQPQDFDSFLPDEMKTDKTPNNIKTWGNYVDSIPQVKQFSGYTPSYFRAMIMPGILRREQETRQKEARPSPAPHFSGTEASL